jgi:hypothetical protein
VDKGRRGQLGYPRDRDPVKKKIGISIRCRNDAGREERRRTNDIRLRSDAPVLVASLGETLDNVGLVAHQSEQTHDLLSAGTDSMLS